MEWLIVILALEKPLWRAKEFIFDANLFIVSEKQELVISFSDVLILSSLDLCI